MTQVVTNPSADREEKIEHAAKFLRKSKQARAVFNLLYKGNKQCKSIASNRGIFCCISFSKKKNHRTEL